MKRWLALALLSFAALAQEFSPEQEARYRQLTGELRCLVCQNQNIADSNAPLAEDLRKQVRSQILAGRSDTEIKSYMVDRYGDFVLYKPPFKLATLMLWLGPVALLLAALAVAVMHWRRSRKVIAAAPVDQAALQKLLQESDKSS